MPGIPRKRDRVEAQKKLVQAVLIRQNPAFRTAISHADFLDGEKAQVQRTMDRLERSKKLAKEKIRRTGQKEQAVHIAANVQRECVALHPRLKAMKKTLSELKQTLPRNLTESQTKALKQFGQWRDFLERTNTETLNWANVFLFWHKK